MTDKERRGIRQSRRGGLFGRGGRKQKQGGLKKNATFSKTHLKNSRGGDTVSALGVETLVNSGSRSVNSAHDSRFFTHLHSHCIFAGLRERSGVIRTGTTVYVFLTPDQARFFCVRRKTQEEHNKKRSVNRRPERCAHKLYSRPARRSFSRSAKPQSICTAKPSTLYHWRCRKHNPIPCIEIAGRFFYRREDLDAFIKR